MSRKAFFLIAVLFILFMIPDLSAQQTTTIPFPKINLDVGTAQDGKDVSVTLQILLMMTVLSLAPSIVCFSR